MEVKLITCTPEAKRLLCFSKETRHLKGQEAWGEFQKVPEAELDQSLHYVFATIGSSWEFVDYVFLITGVTRAFTHQLVRHRVGTSFAQQAQRVVNMEDFAYLSSGDCAEGTELHPYYAKVMDGIQIGYKDLMDRGVRAQDARGVLPTNIHTNILFKVNLRALAGIMDVRQCVRAQGEFQGVAQGMAQAVLAQHPWVSELFGPFCLKWGVCMWAHYQECPIKIKFPFLNNKFTENHVLKDEVVKYWKEHVGYDPQPSAHDWRDK